MVSAGISGGEASRRHDYASRREREHGLHALSILIRTLGADRYAGRNDATIGETHDDETEDASAQTGAEG